jgi:beta-mannosidase
MIRHLFLFLCLSNLAQAQINLGQWEVRAQAEEVWHPAPVPGRVYDALLAAGRIPNPYVGSFEDSVQWVGKSAWVYRTRFEIDSSEVKQALELYFEGIDTYAAVYVNGQKLGETNNVFHPWVFRLDSLLRVGENRVEVYLQSSESVNDSLAKQALVPLPEAHRVFVRKPAFHFGWDWGPKLTAGGITGRVFLRPAEQARIEHWNYELRSLTDSVANLEFTVELHAASPQLHVRALLFNNEQLVYASPGDLPISQSQVRFTVELHEPKRWWPNGTGAPNLYKLYIVLLEETPKGWVQRQELWAELGLRSIELVQEADSLGRSFYFEVNGRPIFIKGANYIPTNHLDAAGQRAADSLLLHQAAAVGMNMIRVWGGGVYPSDYFYELANRLGLLVWQDFMFACAMYPGDTAFLASVAREVDFQVKRLRNQPSLAIWCGNNENWEGWGNWGWQKALGYSGEDSLAVLADYQQLFQRLIPQKLAQLDRERPYTHSSPLHGWGRPEAYKRGDVHYWGVWWGLAPLESYRDKVGRFVSEYGMQSLPEYQSLLQMASTDSLPLLISDSKLRQHQKHPTGFETINTYLQRDFPDPPTLSLYAYASQLLQLRAMETAIEAHRNAMPYCMGTLFWQLNDVWPAISWSAIDHFGRPKALYYGLKRLYAPQLIVVQPDSNGQHGLQLVNESNDSLPVTLELQLWSLRSGKVLSHWEEALVLPPSEVLAAGQVPRAYLRRLKRGHSVLQIRLLQADSVLAQQLWSPLKPKDQHWRNPKVKIEYIDAQTVAVRVRRPAKNIFLEHPWLPSDNYFDLVPGESKVIEFSPLNLADTSIQPMPQQLKWMSLFDVTTHPAK